MSPLWTSVFRTHLVPPRDFAFLASLGPDAGTSSPRGRPSPRTRSALLNFRRLAGQPKRLRIARRCRWARLCRCGLRSSALESVSGNPPTVLSVAAERQRCATAVQDGTTAARGWHVRGCGDPVADHQRCSPGCVSCGPPRTLSSCQGRALPAGGGAGRASPRAQRCSLLSTTRTNPGSVVTARSEIAAPPRLTRFW